MNEETTLSGVTAVGSARKHRFLDRLGRRLVLSQLSRLKKGRLVLIDESGRHVFGRPDDELQVSINVSDFRFYSAVAFGDAGKHTKKPLHLMALADDILTGVSALDLLSELFHTCFS